MSGSRFGTPRLDTLEDVIRHLRRLSRDLDRLSRAVPAVTRPDSQTGGDGVNSVPTFSGSGFYFQDEDALFFDLSSSEIFFRNPGSGAGSLGVRETEDKASILFVENANGEWQIRNNFSDGRFSVYDVASGDPGDKLVIELAAPDRALEVLSTGLVRIYLPTSAPADGDLDNNTGGLWYDSTGPTIEIKHKDSGGTVRTGTVATLS